MFRRGLIHLVVVCALVAPSAAAAQEPVQVDPDSPAGVEYKLPLEQARRDAAGGGGVGGPGAGGGSGSPAPLFGAGITRAGSQGGNGGGAEATPDGSDRAGGKQSEDRADRGVAGAGGRDLASLGAGESGPSSGAAAEDGGGSTGLTLGGIALAVVVVGGALGLALRRGLRTTPAL